MATALLQSIDFKLHDRPATDLLPAGISDFDAAFGGIPRGCVTDIFGPASSGRTSLMLSLISQATAREEFCALVDASDAFDPASAAASDVALDRLLWIRCGGNAEHALQAADLVLQAGGFGLVTMDLGDIAPQTAQRISLASWYRLRHAVEHTPTALVVIERAPNARVCATLAVECSQSRVAWSGTPACSQLLRGAAFAAWRRKPLQPASAVFEARALR
jgi:recombination protein RecA